MTGVWYYDYISLAASEEDSLAPAAASYLKTQTRRAPVATALKLSCTTSFGTMCVASLIITIAEILKRMARQQARNGLLGLLIACCLTCILSYLEFLTRFAISFHALTGESFCDSARTFTDHCSRHGFTALSVDVLSSIVLRFGAMVLSLLIGAITAGAVAGSVEEVAFPTGGYERTIFVLLFGVLGFAIALLPLMFAAGIILNVRRLHLSSTSPPPLLRLRRLHRGPHTTAWPCPPHARTRTRTQVVPARQAPPLPPVWPTLPHPPFPLSPASPPTHPPPL